MSEAARTFREVSWEEQYPADRLVPYDPSWPARYRELAAPLVEVLGRRWNVEHVGSTSVPGLVAKPVIDLALCVPCGQQLSDRTPELGALGWTAPVALGDHEATFMLDGTVRTAIAHVFTAEQWPSAHVRLFAEWLRRHDSAREDYAQLKTSLVNRGVWRSDYTDQKTGFVVGVVNHARAERGLRPLERL